MDIAPALQISSLSKSFAAGRVLSTFTLSVPPGEVVALVGENGSGKSTLIKILSGYHEPDPGGRVIVDGVELNFGTPSASYAAGCRFVHQDLGLVDGLSIADNLSLTTGFPTFGGTVSSRKLYKLVREQLALVGLDVDPRRLVGTLSSAQRTSVAVARALNRDSVNPAKVIVLDEPTATLPLAEVDLLLDMIRLVKSRGIAVIYVTHRLDEIFHIADRVTVLRDGNQVATVATSELDHEKLVHLLVGRELDAARAEAHLRESIESDVKVAAALDVDEIRGADLEGVSIAVRAGEIVGIAGITGSGRDTLLPTIFGARPTAAGAVTVEGRGLRRGRPGAAIKQRVAYLPPDRKTQGAVMNLSVMENLMLSDVRRHWRFPNVSSRKEKAETRKWVESLDIRPPEAMHRPIALLSGGNQQKVLIAKWLRCKPKVFLLDEPTQGVDVGAKATIHSRLVDAAANGMAVVVNSSDVDELAGLCQRVYILRNGQVVAELEGDDVSVDVISALCLGGKGVLT